MIKITQAQLIGQIKTLKEIKKDQHEHEQKMKIVNILFKNARINYPEYHKK